MLRETRYARNGAVSIAFQTVGAGPLDIVLGLGWRSNLDALWEEPRYARLVNSLAAFGRVVIYDARGTGLSDAIPLSEAISLDDRAEDLRCVIEAAGVADPALVAIGASGLPFIRFAATHPERVRALVLVGCAALGDVRGAAAQTGPATLDLATIAPGAVHDPSFATWWAAYLRRSASPSATAALVGMNDAADVRGDLPTIRTKTMVLHRLGDRAVPIDHGRALAAAIPGAVMREFPGDDHLPFLGDQESIVAEIELFLTGARRTPDLDKVLATLVVIEAVDSAETALMLGDRRWAELWARFRAVLGDELQRHGGRRVFGTIDGIVASFDDPVRAVRFAQRTVAGAQPLGLSARAGLHSGELVVNPGVAGVAVHLAARVASLAGPGETLISDTVTGLASGSELTFEPAGEHSIPGQPGEWRLYRIAREGDMPLAPNRTRAERPTTSLSRREREIAALLALGLANRQIADELVISVATVERHVANMLSKLGYRSRTQIAAWAVDHGLVSATTPR